jgi:hypothetical protein
MASSKSHGTKEGGVKLRANSARITRSNVIGRDSIKGISGRELNQIISTLLKYFPKSYLQNPKELDKTLKNLRRYHEQLHEYKELHNKINRILAAFDQFKAGMNRLSTKKSTIELEKLRSLWLPVSIEVDGLLDWSRTIKYIGKPFQMGDKGKEGVDWAVKFSEVYDQINQHGLSIYSTERIDDLKSKELPSYSFSGNKSLWLELLEEYTGRFNSISNTYMYTADENLRKTAEELLILSNKAFSKR